jgi:aspartate aminotransferase
MATEGAINLGLGELDFEPPQVAKEALAQACDAGRSKYGPTAGLMELRKSIAAYETNLSDNISHRNVMVTGGATEGTIVAYHALLDPGDEILVPDPGFVLYYPDALIISAKPVTYDLLEESGYMPDVDQIQESITPKTRAIVVNSPSNPSGGVITHKVQKALLDLSIDHELRIISDEVYEDFVYGTKHYSFSGHLENAIVLKSFSKSLAVPGWRIGYLLAEESLLMELTKVQYYFLACPPTPIQYAINAALPYRAGFISRILPILDSRRRRMVSMLNDIPGFSCGLPSGAFYAFPRYDLNISSRELAEKIVAKGVVVSPGSAFGAQGERHLRFSYAACEDDISKGIEIVKSVVESLI